MNVNVTALWSDSCLYYVLELTSNTLFILRLDFPIQDFRNERPEHDKSEIDYTELEAWIMLLNNTYLCTTGIRLRSELFLRYI